MLAIALIIGFSQYAAATPSTKEELAKYVEMAIQQGDIDALEALYYWEGVDAEMRRLVHQQMVELIRAGVSGIELKPLPEGFQSERIARGVRYRPSLPVTGLIEVRRKAEGPVVATSVLYGTLKAGVYLATAVKSPMSNSSAASKWLEIIVEGSIAPNPVSFEGRCIYIQDGEPVTKLFDGAGSLFLGFWGDRFQACTLSRTSGVGWYRLILQAEGQEIYQSGRLESNQPAVYGEGI